MNRATIIAAAVALVGSGVLFLPGALTTWIDQRADMAANRSQTTVVLELREIRDRLQALTLLVKEIRDREIDRGRRKN